MGPLHTAQISGHRHAPRLTVDRILHPRSIAVLGASDNPAKFGGRITSFLVKHGYAGELFPVSRRQREVLGRKAYRDMGALPSSPDVAILAVPGHTLQSALEEAEAAGVGCCVIISTGFAEADGKGAERQAAIVEISARSGMRILGPNCMGLIVPHHRMALCSSVVLNTDSLADGSIGLVSQSGALMVSMLDRAKADGIGLRYGISCGNQSDLEICDFLDHMIEEQETTAICAYVEGFVDPDRFRRSAIACRRTGKPLLVLKTGRTPAGVVAAQSHTASLAGSFEAFAAICREQGVLLPKSTDDMIWAAHLLTRHPGHRSVHGVAVLSSSGGSAGIASDRLSEEGLSLAQLEPSTVDKLETMLLTPQARNPVDLGGRKVPENVEIGIDATNALMADPNVGYGLVVLASMPSYTQRGIEIVNAALASGKPVLTALTVGALANDARRELRGQSSFYFDGFEDALRVLLLLAEFDRQPGLIEVEAKRPADLPSGPDFGHIAAGVQTETEVKALLALYGVPTAKEIFAKTPQAVGNAAEMLGFPIVLKASSRDVVHKSDVGAVRLGITDRQEAIEVASEMLVRLESQRPAPQLAGFSVQQMVRGEAEVIVGVRRDPQFGPLVIVGLGGTAVEIIGDVAVASAPVSRSHVRKMIDSLATADLFKGVRGRLPLDIDAITFIVERISWLAHDLGSRLVDLEVNPLIVRAEGQGAVAVDGRANIEIA
ncbi:MAG: acetate--CoA ligase family protein [Hyphomicrobiales bacterium]|nr:acetate--CoA ligase family protein [Hyphomicrobiales bacterium]